MDTVNNNNAGSKAHHPVTSGRSWPLGVTADPAGVNVAVWAPEADAVKLCLFDDSDTETRITLPFRDGDVWHGHVADITPGTRYGLRADGPFDPRAGLRFNEAKLLIDPYAKLIDGPLVWDPLMVDCVVEPDGDFTLDYRDSAPVVPKAIVAAPTVDGPDPASNRPLHDLSDMVIYEGHLKGLTATHPDVPEELRGTYAGMAHPAIIKHLKDLGISAIEFLPLQAFIDDEYLVDRGLTNYWGYQPICWLAPEPRYAKEDADAELRHLVHTLHEAGIEVFLDVVYNHTGEGDGLGPHVSYRGLHNRGYYRLTGNGHHYVNDTGTGNTVAAEEPMVMRLMLDSLRHWVEHYGFDGFRFDLAATVGRTEHGFKPTGAFFQAARQDPVLATTKLIAEPWDIGPGGYQLGHFPFPWSEWNDWYRDRVRRVWRGEPMGQLGLASAVLGSSGVFDNSGRGSNASINFVTAHDGYTLADTVSYVQKHNWANLEENRDGHGDNYSDNFGVEGPSEDPWVVDSRRRRVRGMLATLLVSQGVPMILAGDEIGNTQGGNNNAYAQDNEIGWLDWASADPSLTEYVRDLIAVRHRLPVLRQRTFLHSRKRADGLPEVVWTRADGETPGNDDWHSSDFRTVAVQIRGASDDPNGAGVDDHVLIIISLGGDTDVTLPDPGDGRRWQLEIDSARHGYEEKTPLPDVSNPDSPTTYPALSQSIVVLSAIDTD